MHDAVIVDIVRSASGRGKPGGALSGLHPVELLATVLRALVTRTGIDPVLIDDVITGCVGQATEQAANIGRNAVLAAGWPLTVPGTTVDRACGSGQQAMHFAAQGVMAGAYDVVVACGVESMSRVPMGVAIGAADPFGPSVAARLGLVSQGIAAELVTDRWGLTREQLDAYAARSHALAAAAAGSGAFAAEIVPVGEHTQDETIRPATTPEGLAGLKPAFYDAAAGARFPQIGWHITAGNSSPLTDGAAAALIMSAARAAELGLRPRARFHAFALAGDDPVMMLTAPIPATRKVLAKAGLGIDDIDAYEVNEAFAPVPLAWAADLGADPGRLNPRGGAIALGHPLGGSGVRLMATLVNHLEQTGGRYGLQTMCEAGGQANATIVERL
ncbi:acetyl-CoA C-acyltransferase [Dactylosporangium sp. NPDC000244]|uniref:thiolase family protein n=1 Tax=Dactylosporangium sp. NPDC000244 TaxID=3154365 RepID=UPI00331A197E